MLDNRVCFVGSEVFVVPHEDMRGYGEEGSWITEPACQWDVMRVGRFVHHGDK